MSEPLPNNTQKKEKKQTKKKTTSIFNVAIQKKQPNISLIRYCMYRYSRFSE